MEILPEIRTLTTKSEVVVARWLRFTGNRVYKPKWPDFLIFDKEMRPVLVWIAYPGKRGRGRTSSNVKRSMRLFQGMGFLVEVISPKNPRASFVSEEIAERVGGLRLNDLKCELNLTPFTK